MPRAGRRPRDPLARASIDEIAAIDAAPDVDLEVFSHGAICFCYSGLCLLSSFAWLVARPTAACAPSPAAYPTS
ncbi:MAG: U32 family peptidase [Collinsella sp.]